MLILGFFESLQDFTDKIGKYIENNFDNPVLWGVICIFILVVGYYGISKFANK